VTVLPDDFRDLLVELDEAGAEFIIVGGYAVAYHGHVRATKGIDVLVRSTPENAERVYAALARFGAPLASFAVTAGDFATYDGVLQFGIAPLRADILNRIVGVTFDEAIASAESIEVDGRRIPVLGLDALLRAKRAAGRPKDLLDVTELERRRSKT